ncbi:FAD:protein FMN transferase [Xylanibacter muris]|uniref:FAD:protein FMN transferase n=1 Tax=Xylanibacter muris TaxID=2736290 RepID=A0ABX2AP03_9BACT|nr:FAD:protein FMN transferase [Xylanibacter muris]NPD92683.1 FAD:protein FMN transferase [Xylanibacter muris]
MKESSNINANKKKWAWKLPFLIFLIAGTFLIVKKQQSIPFQHDKGFIFGTAYSIIYQYDHSINNEIKDELQKVDECLSIFNRHSTVSHVNDNTPTKINDMFTYIFNLSQKISEDTDGAFDITVAPLVNAWGFGFKNGIYPDKATVDSLRKFTGYKNVRIKNGKVIKENPGIMLDFSAIAKGYGSDVIANYLKGKGIENFMVEIGGEIVVRGKNEKQQEWKIGVTKPTDDSLNTSPKIQTVISLTSKAMATSGNYRNFYYRNGKKYAHTIDPATGYPVQHTILSATVFADNCATADAYATAFMVTGLDKAMTILENHPELMAYFIYSDEKGKNAVWHSPALKDKIQK